MKTYTINYSYEDIIFNSIKILCENDKTIMEVLSNVLENKLVINQPLNSLNILLKNYIYDLAIYKRTLTVHFRKKDVEHIINFNNTLNKIINTLSLTVKDTPKNNITKIVIFGDICKEYPVDNLNIVTTLLKLNNLHAYDLKDKLIYINGSTLYMLYFNGCEFESILKSILKDLMVK